MPCKTDIFLLFRCHLNLNIVHMSTIHIPPVHAVTCMKMALTIEHTHIDSNKAETDKDFTPQK